MKYHIEITADTNDADYVSRRSIITLEEVELIKPVLEAIKNFQPYKGREYYPGLYHTHSHNYPDGEICSKDSGEKTPEEMYGHLEGFNKFDELTPHGEYGIHSIVSVWLLEVQDEIRLL